jgi:rhodanese-related sulfurtransferase
MEAVMKTAKNYIDEANQAVKRVPPEEGIALHQAGEAVFIDVRDSAMIAQTGTIEGAHHVPRGMIELSADPATPYFKDFLQKDAHICIVCGGGITAAMSGKTLQEMGFANVTNVGGFKDWKEAGGPTSGGPADTTGI